MCNTKLAKNPKPKHIPQVCWATMLPWYWLLPSLVCLAKTSYTSIIPCQVWHHLVIYYRCPITCVKILNEAPIVGVFQGHNKWHSSDQVWTPAPELVILNSFKKEQGETGSSKYDFPHSEGQVKNAPNELHPRELTYPLKTSITCSSALFTVWRY